MEYDKSVMTNAQSYFVDFIRFAKDALYLEGVSTNKPCVPANCKCCYWKKAVWSIDPILRNEDNGIDGISVLAY